MIKGLRQGRLHASFDRMIPVLPDLQRECVMRERIVVAMNRKNPLSARSEIDFLALRDEPMIVGDLPNSSLMPAYILARHYSFDLIVAHKANNFISSVCLVAGGFGTCLVPRSLMGLSHPAVVYRPLNGRLASNRRRRPPRAYSTVTLFARLRGLSTSVPRITAA